MKTFSQLKKLLLIINPVSGRRTSLRFLPDIIRIFSEGDYAVTVFPTGKSGDATQFAQLYGNEFDLIVCIGGDGTLNEVISGIIRGDCRTPLGYIPSGSTNDFAACHGISSDMLEAARSIVGGRPKRIDIGKFGEQYFSYVAAFGAFSWLSYTTPQNLKNMLGHSAYLLDAVKDLPKIRAHHLRLDVGEFTCEGDYIFGAVCNSTSLGGLMKLDPNHVKMDDGKFELLLLRMPKTAFDLQSLIAAISRMGYNGPGVIFRHVQQVTVTTDEDLPWSLDGEYAPSAPRVELRNLPGAIPLMLCR